MERESLDSSGRQSTAERPVPAQPSAKEFVFPLSYAQQRLWLLDRLLPTGSVYNVPKVYRLKGALKVDALRSALDELVERHESLRTRFGFEDSGPVQVIAAQLRIGLEVEDLTGVAAGEREGEARRRAQEEGQTPFDLERAPLLRARLLRVDEQEHWLLLTLHHIITDGWSSGVLSRELSELYAAHCRGEASGLPALPVQYADYAVWQREWLQGEVLEQQLAYWKPVLAGLPALELPTDRPRPAIATFAGDRIIFDIDEALTRRIKELGRAERATLFMTLLAAFQVLLYRYSGQEDIAVGAPIAGRVRPELGGLIGFFVNTLVLRGDLSGDPSFAEYLARVRSRALEAYAHQDLPFEKLVEELHPKRDLSRNPLFQVALAMQNTPQAELRLVGIDLETVTDVSSESAKFDLQFSITEVGAVLRTRVEYATDLFDGGTIERMIGHWRVLLEGIVADPKQPVSRLPLLTPEERQALLAGPRATADSSREPCIHQLFEAQVERMPQAVAVVFGEQQLTYAELNARANRLAHQLRGLGVGPDTLVALCMERSLELIVAMLGITKAGGAYVPLDPSYPAQRLAFMLEDTRAPVLVTQEKQLAMLPPVAGRVVCVDRDEVEIARAPATNPVVNANGANLAYVIYTSGSTGQPKGVTVTHRNVARLFFATQRWFNFDERDVWTCFHSASFDFSVWEIWGSLINGARLVIVPYTLSRSPEEFHALLGRERVTVLNQTPSAFGGLIAADARAESTALALRLVILGGEALDTQLLRPWFDRHGDAVPRIVNMYGITETTVHVTYRPVTRADVGAPRGSMIGEAIPDLRVYVLDRYLQPVPIGVPGEIFVGGAGVARGYLNRPELAAERFLTDPFAGDGAARMYRSGDRARRLPSGDLEYLGRMDDQVKIRGFRIELGEIESVLARHADVASAVVTVREDSPGDRRLIAYVLPRGGHPPSSRALREFAGDILPAHMIPGAFVVLERYPLTPSGKVDRARLPAPAPDSAEPTDAYVAPRNDTERILCRIWADVLGVGKVGIDDDFFELGGNSLLGASLFAQLSEEFGQAIPLGRLFEAPTVRRLAEYLRSSTPLDGCVSLVAITARSSCAPLFAIGGAGGNVLGFADLARALGPEQGFYAFQSVGLDGSSEPLESIEAMAQLYLSEMRSMQPRGPYALMGACFGATVAYEMARRLAENGEEVAFLGLLDPTGVGGEDAGRPAAHSNAALSLARTTGRFFASRLHLYRRQFHELTARERFAYVGGKLRMLLRRATGRASFEGVRLEMSLMKVQRANVAALRRFVRKPISGHVKVVAIFETPRRATRAGVEWGSGSGTETLRHIVAGDNSGDMLKGENARVLAAHVAEQLKHAFKPG